MSFDVAGGTPIGDLPDAREDGFGVGVSTETDDPQRRRRRPARIGPGKPLTIRIKRLYLGYLFARPDLLVTSAVKNPLLMPEGVMSMNFYREKVRSLTFLEPSAGAGSDVVFSSPSVHEAELDISIKLHFDGFNKQAALKVVGAATSVAALPAFLGAGAQGQAFVKAASAGASLAIELIDHVVDGNNGLDLSWRLNIASTSEENFDGGWALLYPNAHSSGSVLETILLGARLDANTPIELDGEEFTVDKRGHLHRRGEREEYTPAFPYALVFVESKYYDDLRNWKPAAVSASLASQFLDAKPGHRVSEDVVGALSAYSDVRTVRRIAELDTRISRTTAVKTKAALQLERDGLLAEVQDDTLRKAVAP